jgi:hypothetical protein
LTFNERSTEIPTRIEAFSDDFINAKQVQWIAFKKRLQSDEVNSEFAKVVKTIEIFLTPIVSALSASGPLPGQWKASDTWF